MDANETNLAIGLLVASKGGLCVHYTGIRRFNLDKTPLEEVVKAVASPDFPWNEPTYGEMTSALTINIEQEVTTLVFVLDPSMQAGFCECPVEPGNQQGKIAIQDVKLWPQKGDEAMPHIVSLIADSRRLKEEGDVKFNFAVANVGELGPERRRYRTPITIDPDYPHPPTNGGTGGGFPWP